MQPPCRGLFWLRFQLYRERSRRRDSSSHPKQRQFWHCDGRADRELHDHSGQSGRGRRSSLPNQRYWRNLLPCRSEQSTPYDFSPWRHLCRHGAICPHRNGKFFRAIDRCEQCLLQLQSDGQSARCRSSWIRLQQSGAKFPVVQPDFNHRLGH